MKKNQTHRGFETWFHELQMNVKMHLHIILIIVFFQIGGAALWIVLKYPEAFSLIWKSISNISFLNFNTVFDYTTDVMKFLLQKAFTAFLMLQVLWVLYPFIIGRFKARATKQSETKWLRGARLDDIDTINKQVKRNEQRYYKLGNLLYPSSAEVKHNFIIGRPGTGKTVCFYHLLENIKKEGTKGIIYDFKGDYVKKFYDPQKDILFNPLDIRCQGWNIFNEIKTKMDIDAISASLIPPAHMADSFWNDAARDVFAGLLNYLYANNKKTNKDIWEIVSAPIKQKADALASFPEGKRGLAYIEDASSKQAMGVNAVVMQYAKAFEFVADADGDFTIKDWLEKGTGWIFVTNYPLIKDTLKPILSLFVDRVSRQLLSMDDNYDRRVYFILDELGTLQKLSTIVNLLTLSRSKGGSVWLGIQDVGQLDKIYTEPTRQTIFNACSTTFMFSVSDPLTAKFLSDRIGQHEFEETEESFSMGVEDHRDGVSLARRRKIENLLLPSEIMNLQSLYAFVKLPDYNIAKMQLSLDPVKKLQDRNISFIMKEEFSLENIYAKQQDTQIENTLTGFEHDKARKEVVENAREA